jgi:hypothetical protein
MFHFSNLFTIHFTCSQKTTFETSLLNIHLKHYIHFEPGNELAHTKRLRYWRFIDSSISIPCVRSLLFIHVINLGDDMPGSIMLDERVEVSIVGADRVILHVNANHRSCRRYPEYVDPSIDVGSGAVLADKVVEVLNRAAEQLAVGEAIHNGVFVEGLGEAGDVADA